MFVQYFKIVCLFISLSRIMAYCSHVLFVIVSHFRRSTYSHHTAIVSASKTWITSSTIHRRLVSGNTSPNSLSELVVAEMSTCHVAEVGFNNNTSTLAMLFDIYDIGGHLNVSS